MMQNRSTRLRRARRVFLQALCGVITALLLLSAAGLLQGMHCGTASLLALLTSAAAGAFSLWTEG